MQKRFSFCPLEDEPTLYFYNLPKYDNQGRVARYKVVELWTTADNIANGKVKKVDECYELKEFLKNPPVTLSDELESLLNDLSVILSGRLLRGEG